LGCPKLGMKSVDKGTTVYRFWTTAGTSSTIFATNSTLSQQLLRKKP